MSEDTGDSSTALHLTAAAGVLFVAAVGGIVAWEHLKATPTYVPGEEVPGVVSQLSRDVPKNYPPVTFVDVSERARISFDHFSGERTSQLPEDMGSGLAWGDYDGDGYPDLYVLNARPLAGDEAPDTGEEGGCSALYRNEGDGTFEEVGRQAGVRFCEVGMAAAWGDYDNDGELDLFVSGYGANRLFQNQGDGTFEDVTRQAGLAEDAGFSAGVAWGDYDRDGHLDLYVTRYVDYRPGADGETVEQYDTRVPASLNPSSFPPRSNLLYHNEGDGTFREVADRLGVSAPEGRSLEAVWTDFDGDGWQDLYVANDVSDNVLYRNLGRGQFRAVSHDAGVADYRGAMGLAPGDFDRDGDLDLFITHWIAQENALYQNLSREYSPGGNASGRGPAQGARDGSTEELLFADVASSLGVGQSALEYVGWGTFFFDYDNDGRLDLFVVNGSTLPEEDDRGGLAPMPDQLFWNPGDRKGFYDIAGVSGSYFRNERVGRGAAYADYDRDGDLDVALLNHGGRVRLLRNDGGNEAGWLQVRLVGTESNRSAIGARVHVRAEGEKRQLREVGAQGSYLSQSSRVQHFGLGDAGHVDTLRVEWPGGGTQTFTDVEGNARVVVREGEGLRVRPPDE